MKRSISLTILFLLVAVMLTGCGGSGTKPMANGSGIPVTFNTGDALNDQIAKFELTITAVTLTGSGTTPTTGNLLSRPAEIEFSHEAGSFEPLMVPNVPPGTYSGATLTVTSPEIVVINSGVPVKVPVTLTSGTATVAFSPAVTIASGSNTVVNFDLDLAASVTLNGTPITSATVTPKFTATTSTVVEGNEDDDSGEIEDVHGKVTNITPPNFTIDTGKSMITFATDSNTRFRDGITQLTDLKVGDIVEVDGISKPDGTKLATKVEREGSETGEEVEGIISAVTGSPATLLTIVHQVDSDHSPSAPTTVDIAVNSSTVYSVRADKLNLGTVPAFDSTHIGKGQRIEADSDNGTTAPIVARKVKLREQALLGTIAATPAPTATGFTLTISPTSAFGSLSGQTSITVSIVSGTMIKPGTTLTAGSPVRVRGLVFVSGTTYSAIAARIDNHN